MRLHVVQLFTPISPNGLIFEGTDHRGVVVKDPTEVPHKVGEFVSTCPDAPYAFVVHLPPLHLLKERIRFSELPV
jgi:hypothetical protein